MAAADSICQGRGNPSRGGVSAAVKALLDRTVGEAYAHVQGESLKAYAALLWRLSNSPITRRGVNEAISSDRGAVYDVVIGFGAYDLLLGDKEPVPAETQSGTQPETGASPIQPAAALAGPPTGPGDPYASGQQRLGANEYEHRKAELLAKASEAASAARCRVIADAESQVIDLNGINSISAADISAGRSDYHPDVLPAVRAAAAQAYQAAGQPGGCAYWEQNPEAVAAMREQAQLATRGN